MTDGQSTGSRDPVARVIAGAASEPRSDESVVGVPQQRSGAHESLAASGVKLSVIMAAFNEARTIRSAVLEVLRVDMPCDFELIVIDDGSQDATAEQLASIQDHRLRVVQHHTNLGKGTAMRTGRRYATGTHVVPFDADLEYTANDLARLVAPVVTHGYPVVIGTRNSGQHTSYAAFRFAIGNRILTRVANVAFDADISDLHSCLKLVSTDLLRSLPLRETGFGADTELVAALLKRGIMPFEVPISYRGRSRAEGKKIGWRDAVECVAVIGKHRLFAAESVPTTTVVLDLTGPDRDPTPARVEPDAHRVIDLRQARLNRPLESH